MEVVLAGGYWSGNMQSLDTRKKSRLCKVRAVCLDRSVESEHAPNRAARKICEIRGRSGSSESSVWSRLSGFSSI